MSEALFEKFDRVYNSLSKDNLGVLDELYDADVVFIDPIREIRGLPALKEYCGELYANVVSCKFEIGETFASGDRAFAAWTMRLEHGRFRRGETLELPGCTHLRLLAPGDGADGGGDKIAFHRDYYDLGAMIYERLPVLGGAIRKIKARL